MSVWPKLAAAGAVPGLFALGRLVAATKGHLPSSLYLLATLLFVSLSLSFSAIAAPTVGMVTKVINQAQVGGETAVVGTLVHMNDTLTTGPKARLLVTFRDKTELTLGENAHVVVDRYVFDPEAGTGELVLNTTVAAFRLATGEISKMRNRNITVSTPLAALAVRGTDFWWGPIDGQFGVLLVSNSKVHVENERGAVMLAKSGWGTDIEQGLSKTKAFGAPGRPYEWPPEKVARALAQTNIGLAVNPGVISPLVPLIPIIVPPEPPPPPRSP